MKTQTIQSSDYALLDSLPMPLSPCDIFNYLEVHEVDSDYVSALFRISGGDKATICDWLKVTKNQFSKMTSQGTLLTRDTQEHVLLLLGIMSKGIDLFGSQKALFAWLDERVSKIDGYSRRMILHTHNGASYVFQDLEIIARTLYLKSNHA